MLSSSIGPGSPHIQNGAIAEVVSVLPAIGPWNLEVDFIDHAPRVRNDDLQDITLSWRERNFDPF